MARARTTDLEQQHLKKLIPLVSHEPLRGSRVSWSTLRGLADYMRVGSFETLQQLADCVILRSLNTHRS